MTPVIPVLEIYSKNPETPIQKNICTTMFIAALCAQVPISTWVDFKNWYTMEFYEAEKKKELLPFMTVWMELESIMLNEIIQSVKDKYHMTSLLTGI